MTFLFLLQGEIEDYEELLELVKMKEMQNQNATHGITDNLYKTMLQKSQNSTIDRDGSSSDSDESPYMKPSAFTSPLQLKLPSEEYDSACSKSESIYYNCTSEMDAVYVGYDGSLDTP